MKRVLLVAACLGALLVGTIASADDAPAKKAMPAKAKASKSTFLVIIPHTAEECTKAMDSIEASKALDKFSFGCEAGDHTAYAMFTAADEQAAMAMVPADQREKAKVVKLTKFTPAQLKAMHEKM